MKGEDATLLENELLVVKSSTESLENSSMIEDPELVVI